MGPPLAHPLGSVYKQPRSQPALWDFPSTQSEVRIQAALLTDQVTQSHSGSSCQSHILAWLPRAEWGPCSAHGVLGQSSGSCLPPLIPGFRCSVCRGAGCAESWRVSHKARVRERQPHRRWYQHTGVQILADHRSSNRPQTSHGNTHALGFLSEHRKMVPTSGVGVGGGYE